MWWLAHGEHEVPVDTDWLTPREQSVLAGIRYTKRRVESLTRRWTTKRAVAAVAGLEPGVAGLRRIEIRHHPGGAPWVAIDGREAEIAVSTSDRAGWAVCLVRAPGGGGGTLGIDLELVEPRTEAFVADFFTADERAAVGAIAPGAARDETSNLIWSAKESALKVLQVGLRADTREVHVEIGRACRDDGWLPLTVTHRDGSAFPGWWRRDGVFVLTLAAREPAPPPTRLAGSGDLTSASPVHSWMAQPLV
jgi:4'-phosphopantetheinyl transferase